MFPRSPEFSDFLRHALDKNVDNRWSAAQLLQVSRSVPSLYNVIPVKFQVPVISNYALTLHLNFGIYHWSVTNYCTIVRAVKSVKLFSVQFWVSQSLDVTGTLSGTALCSHMGKKRAQGGIGEKEGWLHIVENT